MARALASFALVIVLASATAHAQPHEPAEATSARRVLRPPEGSLRRGRFPVPDWAVYGAGGMLVLGAAGMLVFRSSSRRR